MRHIAEQLVQLPNALLNIPNLGPCSLEQLESLGISEAA
jgi:hypothetical protein